MSVDDGVSLDLEYEHVEPMRALGLPLGTDG
jgi:hypothetical protein